VKLAYAISTSATRFTAVGHGADLAGTLRFLAGLGFDGVELAVRDPSLIDVEAILDETGRLGLTVPAIGTGQAYLEEGLYLTAADAGVRDRTAARLVAQADVARRLRALLIVGLIHGPVPPDTDRETAAERLLDALGRVARAARDAGVRIVIEPINRYESNWLNTVNEVSDLIGRLGEDNVGVLPDTFHMNIEEADVLDALRRARPRLWHVHVADSNRRAPGAGHLDWSGIVTTLREIGYAGCISAEILQQPSLQEAARMTIGTMRALVPRG
jgi:sugar phosphate isomerase/epimerase